MAIQQASQAKRRRGVGLLTSGAMLFAATIIAASPSHAAETEELIENGDFEDGTTGWISNDGNDADGATLEITDDAYEGAQALEVSDRLTTGSGPLQDLSGKIQAGQSYEVSAYVKYEDEGAPADKQFFLTMHNGGGDYTNLASVTAERGEWSEISGTFSVDEDQDVSTARIFIETPWVSDPDENPSEHLMDFVVDEVSLIGAAAPPAPSSTIEVEGKEIGDHNPILGHKFGADGFGFVHDDRVYMYMTNDGQRFAPDPETGMPDQIDYGDITQINLVSSNDLVNWVDHGAIEAAGSEGVAPYTNNSWAPGVESKVIDGEEKFFLYYANGGGSSAVITGDSPLGPWYSERDSVLVDGDTPGGEGAAWAFDPAPFIDDDGEAYFYYGGGPASEDMPDEERFNNPKNLRSIKLGDDMISVDGEAQVVDAPVAFEAGHVFKRDDLYYLTYSSHFGGPDFGGDQERAEGYPAGGEIGYMISDDPMEWDKDTYAGVIFPNQSEFFGAGTGGNNHQSAFEYEGQYYFTYHAPTLNKRITGDETQGYRSPHIQELEFNDDGTAVQVEGDYEGVDQVRDFEPYRAFEAETLGWSKGVATQTIDEVSQEFGEGVPNLALTDIQDGDWAALSSVAFGDEGAQSVTGSVKPLQEGAEIAVRADGPDGPELGRIDVDGEAGEWADFTAELSGAQGTTDVFFTFEGPEGDLFEVDAWEFEPASEEPDPEPDPDPEPEPDPEPTPDPSDPEPTPGDSEEPGNDQGAGDETNADGSKTDGSKEAKELPRTGSELLPLLSVAFILLALGALTIHRYRKARE